jgi:hypothetical protein
MIEYRLFPDAAGKRCLNPQSEKIPYLPPVRKRERNGKAVKN